jgi:hypothetical protein
MMQICKPSDGQAPTIKRDINEPGLIPRKSNPTLSEAIAEGWREYVPLASTPANTRTVAWVDDGARYTETVTEIWTAEELAAQETQRQAESAAADLLANGERYVAENEYILLCDAIAGTPGAHTRLGLGDLQTALVGLIANAPARQNAIFQYLMGLQIGLQRLGGVNWWDNCTWHDQAAIVNAAGERHSAIMAVLP